MSFCVILSRLVAGSCGSINSSSGSTSSSGSVLSVNGVAAVIVLSGETSCKSYLEFDKLTC